MKKKVIIAVIIVVLIIAAYVFGSGLRRESSAYIGEFSVAPDGTEITMQIGVGSSMGYIRKVAVHQQHGGKLYLDCYSAFGGINGSLGAKTEYTVQLDEDTKTIALYRASNGYEVILEKDNDGVWRRTR